MHEDSFEVLSAQAQADWWRGVSSSSQEMAYITDRANGPKVLLGCTICNNKGTEKSNWMASWLKGCFPMKLEDRVACRIDQDGEATPGL